jgi:FkbM family methyltransferase
MLNAVFEYLANWFAKSRIFCALSQRTLQISDNDSNVDMHTNGEQELMKTILPLLDKSSVVIDVGCNVGIWSTMICELGYKGSLVMLDMDDDACWQSHLAIGKYSKIRTEIITAIVGGETRMDGKYYKGKDCSHNSVYDMRVIGDLENKVDVFISKVTLVKLCEERSIDHVSFLKIDVEGGELDVLIGAKQLLENQKIDFIQFEYGDAATAARVFLTDIVTLLHSFGYTVYKIMPKSLKHIEVGANLNRSYSCSNFFATSAKSSYKLKMHMSGV